MEKLSNDSLDKYIKLRTELRSKHYKYHEERDELIKKMYDLLIQNDYTRDRAINTIYVQLSNYLNSMIEVRKTHIENITKKGTK